MKRWVQSCFAEGFRHGVADRRRGAVRPSALPPWPKLEDCDYAAAYQVEWNTDLVFGEPRSDSRQKASFVSCG
jgi:hypothetical protein